MDLQLHMKKGHNKSVTQCILTLIYLDSKATAFNLLLRLYFDLSFHLQEQFLKDFCTFSFGNFHTSFLFDL